jgi:hypothetical protein
MLSLKGVEGAALAEQDARALLPVLGMAERSTSFAPLCDVLFRYSDLLADGRIASSKMRLAELVRLVSGEGKLDDLPRLVSERMTALDGMLDSLMKQLLAFGAGILMLAELAGCSASQKEISRQSSPNQKLVAVLMESLSDGAQGSVREDIYLNDQGVALNLDKPVFSAVGCDRLSFDWANDYTLQIHYERTCAISQFTNRWLRPSDVAAGRPNPIEIVLIRI